MSFDAWRGCGVNGGNAVSPRERAQFSNRKTRRCLFTNSGEEVEVSLYLVRGTYYVPLQQYECLYAEVVLVENLKRGSSTSMYGGGGLHRKEQLSSSKLGAVFQGCCPRTTVKNKRFGLCPGSTSATGRRIYYLWCAHQNHNA